MISDLASGVAGATGAGEGAGAGAATGAGAAATGAGAVATGSAGGGAPTEVSPVNGLRYSLFGVITSRELGL